MNKHSTFESAIVRILTDNHELVGIGLLVDANHIVTCAHVVSDALHYVQDTQNVPTQNVLVNFLHTNPDHILEARIEVWDYDNDVCVLEYAEQLPAGITPQLMLEGRELADHHFEVYGVPRNNDVGIWSSGILRRSVSGGYIHVEDVDNFGYFIEPGFSGAPVWDKSLRGYVGLVSAADRNPERRTAFIIPTARIRQVWPSLPCITSNEDSNLTSHSPVLESPYGTVPVDSSFYIERQSDRHCLNEFVLVNRGTIYIQAPRQMGKSSLMQKTLHRLREIQSTDHAFIDFHRFQNKQLVDMKSFLVMLCKMVSNRFNISESVDQYWSNGGSDLDNCSNFIQSILSQLSGSVIIAMDEVDRVLGRPWQDDFFGMLRTWHEEAAFDPDFRRLRLFLSSSTEPHLFIENPNQSPFNIVRPIELDGFTVDQIHDLTERHRIALEPMQEKELLLLLDGHPCLTRIALYQIALGHYDYDSLIRNAADDDGPFGDHLKHLRNRLTSVPELRNTIRQICRGQSYSIDTTFFRLKGAGLVKISNSQVVMRNQLYEQYFKLI